MKRSKEDDKSLGPMFPRLHVNDTIEKGGPRAPPRNKMALYEQLSIPSQRCNHGAAAFSRDNPTTNDNNLVSRGSSNQGSVPARDSVFPHQVPASTSAPVAERFPPCSSSGGQSYTPLGHSEQRKKVGDEDDFTVPVFVQFEMSNTHSRTRDEINLDRHAPMSETFSGRSTKNHKINGNDPKQISSTGVSSIKEVRNQSKEVPEACVLNKDQPVKTCTSFPTREMNDRLGQTGNASSDQHRLHTETRQNSLPGSQPDDGGRNSIVPELMTTGSKGNVDQPRRVLHLREERICPSEPEIDCENHGDNMCVLQNMVGERSDDVSETSMVDLVSALDITPDDVVQIIGQKHFWKARKAIVNQQRVFAVQVFELHRLIKVQQLIAESPHLLSDDGNLVDKPSLKDSPIERLPSDYVVIPNVHVGKRKGDSDKQNYTTECSAENAAGKVSISSVKNGSQPSDCGSYGGNPTTGTANADNKMVPWCYPQSMGHQWLMPVMSPTEGLIYKPYVPPGYMGSGCGGCGPGPYASTPFSGNYMNPGYAVPTPHHHHNHQGVGMLPGAPPFGHGYFPPYGMPMMSQPMSGSVAERMNCLAGADSQGQSNQQSGGRATDSIQLQSSCNMQTQKPEAGPQVKKPRPYRDTELQRSTASSPSGRVQEAQTREGTKPRDALPLFATSLSASAGDFPTPAASEPTRVIRVVPHNRRSATESAARIFQSIQRERKQDDSI